MNQVQLFVLLLDIVGILFIWLYNNKKTEIDDEAYYCLKNRILEEWLKEMKKEYEK